MPPKNNAFIQFTDVLKTHRDERSNSDVTVLAGHKPVLTGLTEDILLNGDLNTLLDFYDKNQDRMTEEEKQYMQIRIDSATEVSRLKQKAINDLAEGNVPQGPEPQKSEDGMIGFPDIKNPGVQTSSNGCWSMAYSLLLKSRGVDLSQERIRAWRPDQTKNPIPAELQNVASKESAISRMNVDGGNTISENPDLVTQVLPNTALRSVKIDPLSYETLTLDGNPVTDQNDKDKIKANYIKQASMMLSSTVSNAINKDHSPVAITYHGHFLTITGISEDGKSVRLEDTQQANPNDRTSIVSIESIVTDAMSERALPNGEKRYPTGFELNWLHDLKVPEFDKKNNQQIDIPEHDRMFMNPDTDGNLNIDVPSSYIQASNIGNPSAGQIEGKGVTISVVMDMDWLSQDLGGKKVESVISSSGNYTFGHSDTYYPNRVLYPKDPQLQANRQSETQMQDNTRMMLNEAGLNNNLNQSTPTQTTTQTTTQTPTQTTPQPNIDPNTINQVVNNSDETMRMVNNAFNQNNNLNQNNNNQQSIQNQSAMGNQQLGYMMFQMNPNQMQNLQANPVMQFYSQNQMQQDSNMQQNPNIQQNPNMQQQNQDMQNQMQQQNQNMQNQMQQGHQFNPDFIATLKTMSRIGYSLEKQERESGNTLNPIQYTKLEEEYTNLKNHIKMDPVLSNMSDPQWEQKFDQLYRNNRTKFTKDVIDYYVKTYNLEQEMNSYDPNFLPAARELKQKVDQATQRNYAPEMAYVFLKPSVEKLWGTINNDPYLAREFRVTASGFVNGYNQNPLGASKNLLKEIDRTFELKSRAITDILPYEQPQVNRTQQVNQSQVNQANQTTQVNQSQANQTQQHQYSQEFINALHALKQSAQAEIDNAQTVQSMKAHLKTPFENLIKEIKKDPYIPAVIGDNNWEQNLKIGFEADPARYCLRTVDHLGNNLGINDQINAVQNNQRNNQRDNDPNAISNKIEARWNYLKENVDVKGKVSALGRKQILAEIVALSELGARKRARGVQNPKVTDQELEDFTNRVMNDELFNRLIANGNDLNLARNGDTKKIIIGIGKVNDQLKKENNYAITKHIRLKQKRCKYIANRLEASLTGSYDGLGVIKRGSNSDGFEDALDAIREFSEMERPKGTDVYKAVQTVKDYLSDKMGTVVRGFGRERWGQCMLFLKETMPRKEFEEYCQQINKARGVENNPQSKKYISPEMFGFKKEPVSSILAETRDRILSGKGTERDYAVLITLRNRYDYFGTFDGSKTLEKETDRRRFIRETEKTLKSENFRRFITEINEAQRRALLQGDCDGLAGYEENLPALEVDPNAATNTAQNTNQATTNNINTQNTNQPNQVHLTHPGATNNRTTNTPAGRSQTMVTTPQQSAPHM